MSFYSSNDETCIENDEICIKHDEFELTGRGGRWLLEISSCFQHRHNLSHIQAHCWQTRPGDAPGEAAGGHIRPAGLLLVGVFRANVLAAGCESIENQSEIKINRKSIENQSKVHRKSIANRSLTCDCCCTKKETVEVCCFWTRSVSNSSINCSFLVQNSSFCHKFEY